MLILRIAGSTAVALSLWASAAGVQAADDGKETAVTADPMAVKAAEAALKELGLRRQGNSLVLAGESELAKLLADQKKLKREIVVASKVLGEALAAEQAVGQQLHQFRLQRRELSAELASVKNVERHNRIVGQINEFTARIDELQEDKTSSERVKAARQDYSAARERYVQHILESRKLADTLRSRWADLAHDAAAKTAVERLSAATGKTFVLEESRNLQNLAKSLEKIEESVLSESIALRRDGGDTLLVDVTMNAKHTREMCLDSGASIVVLPYKMAEELDLTPGESAESLLLVLADGRTVQAKRILISSVRVGKFTVQNVEGAVLPAELTRASALLGMSFLVNFKFDIDPRAGKLSMTRVEGDEMQPSKTSVGEKPARSRKKDADR